MYKDIAQFLETDRPNRDEVLALLGPSGYKEQASLNGADIYYVYQVDLGQSISGVPYLYKMGIAFHEDGSYSHIAIWD